MSKIEDALKKAKEIRKVKSDLNKAINENTQAPSNVRSLSISKNTTSIASRLTSSREIALMKDDVLLDSKELSKRKIINPDIEEDAKIANSYRDLRTKLLSKSNGKNFIAMVTSCVDDGSSAYVASNMATAFALEKTKTSLLIDCNLINPELHNILKKETQNGLIDYLENEDISVESILHSTGIQRLRFIPAGTRLESTSEYFTSHRLQDLISDLLLRYSDRYIFINTASIIGSADSRILVGLCDFVVLVVPYAKATKAKVKEAADAIGKDKLLGVVFSDVPKTPNLGVFGL